MNSISRIEAQKVAATAAKARFTSAEFLRMVETGAFADMKVELVDGELERMTPPGRPHGQRQMQIGIRLSSLLPENRLSGEVGLILNDDTVLACDVAVLREPMTTQGMLESKDVILVIEIAETTIARDMGMKRAKYAAADINEYWVVDGARSVVHVFAQPVDGDYASINTVRFGAPLAVPGTERTIVID
jgi:Uma2 family endonuclease